MLRIAEGGMELIVNIDYRVDAFYPAPSSLPAGRQLAFFVTRRKEVRPRLRAGVAAFSEIGVAVASRPTETPLHLIALVIVSAKARRSWQRR
jgi:hypothetical protein